MTGILQLFDYQDMLTTGHITGYSMKRNPIGGSHFNEEDASEMESMIICDRTKPMKKHFNKHVEDKRTIYTESSGFPSSLPTHSSSNCSNTYQQDTLLFDPLILPENCSTRPRTRQLSTSTQLYRQPPHYLQEVVKDSMHQEARKQPSKTKARDSLAKQKNTQRTLNEHDDTSNEPKEHSRSSSYQSKEFPFFSNVKDAHRFPSFKPRDVSKYQDMARISLDSRESSTPSVKSETQPNLFMNPSRVTFNFHRNHQNSGTQIRTPSVVAKLMGLEALPNSSISYSESKTSSVEPSRPIQVSVQSKVLSKESNSPGSSINPVSRLPVEPAPWKQVDRSVKDSVKTRNTFPSVYSEIEKRLKDLEFSQSGKDLRALKQILEAMQEKEEEEPRFAADQKGHGRKYNPKVMPVGIKSPNPKNELIYSFTKKGGNFSRNYESPIVIMKPAKHTGKSDYPVDELSSDTRSNSRVSKPVKNGSMGSLKSNESIILKNIQKKPESEKRSRPRVPLTDSGRSKTRSNKQGNGSSSMSRRHRSSYSIIQRNDEEMSEISNESTNLSSHENDNSAQSDGMDIEAATSSEKSLDVINYRNPFTKTFQNSVTCLIDKESTLHGIVDGGLVVVEHPEIATEYQSPVSVLDNILDMDDSLPSPIKHQAKISRGYETRDSDILPTSDTMGSGFPSEFNRKKLKNIENLVQKLQSVNSSHDEARTDYIASLCEKNTNPDHRYISEILLASGILLSDIGSSLTNFQFHPSGHPINPGLFLVLEQTKATSSFLDYPPEKTSTNNLRLKQKIHRKIIFDTINEVLARKLLSLEQQHSGLRSRKLARTTLNAQKLLRELCLEIDELQSKKTKQGLGKDDDGLRDVLQEDVMNPSEEWLDNMNKVSSGIVLDIERLVFKDLVDEVLVGETPGLINNSSRRRQLFPKY